MSNSVVVTTEEELRVACEKKVEHILIKGDLAKTVEKNMKQRKTRKKFMIGSVAIAGLGFIAAPFTGGASIPIAGLLAAEGGAVGGAAVSTIAILLAGGLGLSIITVLAGYELEYSTSDGTSIKLKPSNSKEK